MNTEIIRSNIIVAGSQTMEDTETSTQLLKKKYELHKSPEVEMAAKRFRFRTGEKISQDPLSRIQNYLSRFHEITGRLDLQDRGHGLDAAKRLLHSKFVIKPNEVPQSYFENQRRMARELGHGDIEITQDVRDQLIDVIVTDQKSSLDKWIDYLSSGDAPYPDALKYFTLRSVLSMGEYDKEKHAFTQRSKSTVKPFPDLNREALAYVLDAIDKKYRGQNINDTNGEEFERLLRAENFAKLYAWAIEKVTPTSVDKLRETKGNWVMYPQNSDHRPLVASIQGHGTGWCTAGESTAQAQLQGGDFYIYYSFDEEGKPNVPRLAIRMEEQRIAEVRGIAPEQNIDPYVSDVLEEKLKEFPDGAAYKKKVADMKLLTQIEHKIAAQQELTSAELTFLYEVNDAIEGFGYERDPRIAELRSQRDPNEDMPIVFNCRPDQIAKRAKALNKGTKAYVGALEPGIFDKLQKYDVEHAFTTFPEGRIRFDNVTSGSKGEEVLEKELDSKIDHTTSYAISMMRNRNFNASEAPQTRRVVILRVQDLPTGKITPTLAEIFGAADKVGLDKITAEEAVHYRLQYLDQPLDEWLFAGMDPIAASGGIPGVF